MINQLLELGIMPIINENDAVSRQDTNCMAIPSLIMTSVSMVAVETDAHVLILLTDVEGVYDRPPTEPDASLIDIFRDRLQRRYIYISSFSTYIHKVYHIFMSYSFYF